MLVAAAGCGRKGPPLPPLVRMPAPVTTIEARRTGSEVYVTFTVPDRNVDASQPADVARVDVFAATAVEAPSPERLVEIGTRLASLAIAPPPDPEQPEQTAGPPQGSVVTIREVLRPDDLNAPPANGDDADAAGAAPRRFYLAVPVSPRGRAPRTGSLASVPLTPPPPAPAGLEAVSTAEATTLTWIETPGAAGYNVYPTPADPDAAEPADDAVAVAPPVPLNAAPLDKPAFSVPVEFDVERCFVVRAIREEDGSRVEGEGSRTCHTARDTFPPAPPMEPIVQASDEGILVRWDASPDPDVAGYLVLRGRAGDATLLPITPEPIAETRFLDRSVASGTRYVYAVVAVDARGNRSRESSRDEETAP